jgi:hypothetical protein
MKKIILASLILAMVVGLGITFAAPDKKGNGLPKGKSYNFNVIGVPNPKNWDEDSGGQGKRIFVLRTGTTQFYVQGGDTFEICDHDGTDGKVGEGGGPTPDPDDIETAITKAGIILPYDTTADAWDCLIFVRLLGPVDSSFRWKSYFFDDDTTDGNATINEWVLIDDFVLDRNTKFQEKTGQLLADGYEDILWEWSEKNKLRICQFRIYVIED